MRDLTLRWMGAWTLSVLLTCAAIQPEVRAESPSESPGDVLSSGQLAQLAAAASDSGRCDSTARQLRGRLSRLRDSTSIGAARQLLVVALVACRAPTAELLSAADSALAALPRLPGPQVTLRMFVAGTLAERGEGLATAYRYAREALSLATAETLASGFARDCATMLGHVLTRMGRADSALRVLGPAATVAPDDQALFLRLGEALEAIGAPDSAILAYTRSAAVFGGTDQRAMTALRRIYPERGRSLDGLARAVAVARDSSKARVLAAHRAANVEEPAWSFATLAGKRFRLREHRGQVVVLEFWGTWCSPCLRELPILQEAYRTYGGRGVSFLAVNVELEAPDRDVAGVVRDFVRQHAYTFPVAIESQRDAAERYGITSFPTTYVIDRRGRIRFRNVGATDDGGALLRAEVEIVLRE